MVPISCGVGERVKNELGVTTVMKLNMYENMVHSKIVMRVMPFSRFYFL